MSMSADEGDRAIVASTIELARNLGHTVVAEGVEDQVTWEQLAEPWAATGLRVSTWLGP